MAKKTSSQIGKMYGGQVSGTKIAKEIGKMMGYVKRSKIAKGISKSGKKGSNRKR